MTTLFKLNTPRLDFLGPALSSVYSILFVLDREVPDCFDSFERLIHLACTRFVS